MTDNKVYTSEVYRKMALAHLEQAIEQSKTKSPEHKDAAFLSVDTYRPAVDLTADVQAHLGGPESDGSKQYDAAIARLVGRNPDGSPTSELLAQVEDEEVAGDAVLDGVRAEITRLLTGRPDLVSRWDTVHGDRESHQMVWKVLRQGARTGT